MKRVLLLASAALVLGAAAAGAQTYVLTYVLTNGSAANTFTATMNGVALAENVSQDSALNTIRRSAIGNPVTIQMGSGNTLDMGSGSLRFGYLTSSDGVRYNFTKIRLTGAIKSTGTYALSFDGSSSGGVTDVEIAAGAAIEGGLAAYSGYNFSITGGAVTITNNGYMYFGGSSKVTITGGTFTKAATLYEIIDFYGSELTISGGVFESKGNQVLSARAGKTVISGTAELKSDTAKTQIINISGSASVSILGGKVLNTADSGVAVNVSTPTATLTLGGSPEITGAISLRYADRVVADAAFSPGSRKYNLLLAGAIFDNGAIVVRGGAAHLSSFVYVHPPYTLASSGGNIILSLPANFVAPKYTITAGADSGYIAKKAGGTKEWSGSSIRTVMDSIRIDAAALPCSVQLGNGTQFLKVGSGFSINGSSGDGWGKVTLLGKFSGTTTSSGQGGPIPIFSMSDATVDNFADIMYNDSSVGSWPVRLGANATYTHKGGTMDGGIYLYNSGGITVTVTGGKVGYISNRTAGNGNTIAVSGGTVGDSTLVESAIYSNVVDCDIIISGGTVISADTSSGNGTIVNRGRLAITGGKIINAGTGDHRVALLNGIADTDTASVVTISGTAEIYSSKKERTNSDYGVINNARGSMVISGGKVYSGGDSVSTVIANRNNARLVITGSAEIKSEAVYLGEVITNSSVLASMDSAAVSLEISGGKIIANNGLAVYGRNSKTSISGAAELKAPDAYGVVYMSGGARLFLLGGTVTSTSNENVKTAIFAYSGGSGGGVAGRITLGGSPTLTGCIRYGGQEQYGKPITILTAGASAFSPGGKKYNLYTNVRENDVVMTDGARFTSSFTLDTAALSTSGLRLAASGNDAVATAGATYDVDFDIMGAKGTKPATIKVVVGATLGESAKPATNVYVSADGFKNDGKWYRSKGMLGGQHIQGPEFKFGLGNDGTKVNDDITLILAWTTEVSVASGSREVPAAAVSEAVAIAPIAVTAGELTAGPNPSAKRTGTVAFFWNGAALKGGTLQVYDAAGNAVSKVSINDNAGVSGRRQVAAWNLTDAKGRPAADGAYIAKGVIKTKSGKSERVSIVLGVR